MRYLLLTILLALGPASWATAAPFNPEHVAADAKWIIHLDVEAMRATAVGKMCGEEVLSREELRRHLDKMREEIGMDPSEDLLGATMYDTQFKKEHGVAMIRVRQVDGTRLIAKLNEKEPGNRMLEYKKHELYLWTKRCHGKEMTVCGTLHDNQVMIFSRDPLKVIAALDVLDGRAIGLSDDSRLASKGRPGTVLLMRGVDLASSDKLTKCPILKDSTWMEVAMGASGSKSFATMVVDTESTELAESAKMVMDGFVALARLKHGQDETFGKVIDGIKVSASDASLSVDWSADEEDVMKVIKQVHQKMEAHKHSWKKKRAAHDRK